MDVTDFACHYHRQIESMLGYGLGIVKAKWLGKLPDFSLKSRTGTVG